MVEFDGYTFILRPENGGVKPPMLSFHLTRMGRQPLSAILPVDRMRTVRIFDANRIIALPEPGLSTVTSTG
jgi:hypothetical protein